MDDGAVGRFLTSTAAAVNGALLELAPRLRFASSFSRFFEKKDGCRGHSATVVIKRRSLLLAAEWLLRGREPLKNRRWRDYCRTFSSLA